MIHQSGKAPTVPGESVTRHIRSLDALRGFAALGVVLFHLQQNGMLRMGLLIEHGDVFVDLFFVLSGFVISRTYGAQLCEGRDRALFVARRAGRLLPLHLLILGCMLVFQVIIAVLRHKTAASGLHGDHSIPALLASASLLHGVGLYNIAVWNGPSWSISVEFYAYLSFVLAAPFLKRGGHYRALLISSAAALTLYSLGYGLDPDMRFRFFRCVVGFYIGVATYYLAERLRARMISNHAALVYQLCAMLCCLFAIALVHDRILTFSLPLLFASLVFSLQIKRTALSKFLEWKPLLWLGDCSYASYMIHIPVLNVADRLSIQFLMSDIRILPHEWIVPAYLLIVYLLAGMSFRFIESPARTAVGKWAGRRLASNAVRTTAPVLAQL